MTSPSAGAPALKYGDVNTVTPSPGEVKGLIKMVKKINKDAITIKELLKKGMKQFQIAKLLNLKRAKVNYWSKAEIKNRQFKKKKLNDQYK